MLGVLPWTVAGLWGLVVTSVLPQIDGFISAMTVTYKKIVSMNVSGCAKLGS
jgi:hypothetical protein